MEQELEFIEPQIDLIIEDNEYYSKYAQWCNENNCYIEEIEAKEDGTRQFQIKEIVVPQLTEEEKLNQLKKSIIDSVQKELDTTAQSKGYDNGFALASYSNSTDEIFKQEAEAFVVWRDKCWRYCYDLLDKYLANEIEEPTVEYVLENMPKVEW